MKTFYALVFLFCASTFAGNTFQILYNSPQGDQRLDTFGPGGATAGQVVWDESKDGPLPAGATVGYAERYTDVNGKPALRPNAAMQTAYNAAQAAAAAAAAQKATDLAAWNAIKVKLNAGTATQADVAAAVKTIVKNLGQ